MSEIGGPPGFDLHVNTLVQNSLVSSVQVAEAQSPGHTHPMKVVALLAGAKTPVSCDC